MADDILSQEEVDALLRGVTGEQEESGSAESAEQGIRAYDIGRQERIVRGRMPTRELINERFARRLRIELFNFTRRNAEISVGPVRVLKYSEFVRNLVVPTNLNVVQAKPLRGYGLMVIEPTLVFQIIDHLFGGQGRFHTRVEGRDFTATEMRVIRRLLELVFGAYGKAWQPVQPLEFEYVRSEMNTQFANIATPAEVVVAMSFSIDLGSGGGDFHVCIPYAMLEPIRNVIYSGVQADRSETDDRWTKLLSAHVYDAQVQVNAKLATASVTLRQLMSLQPGDVIALDLPDTISAEVDGVPVLQGRYGVVNGRYALKVERPMGNSGADVDA
ncbi:MAG: flagellar motor switch protein FliM [Proteobacteria bacterium]|nr:flagellar motor switch protein FliM [Pseudomonadota bacterium]